MVLPWFAKKEGYTIKINGQLFYLDASTSLQVSDIVCPFIYSSRFFYINSNYINPQPCVSQLHL